jgi:hypothetical protein
LDIKSTKLAIKFALKIGRTPNLIGLHGEGKSSVVKQLAKEMGYHYKEFRTGQAADAGDLTGLPEFYNVTDIDENGKEFTYKVTNFVLPDWFPRKPNTLVFFDEVNRGAKDILNGVFEAILDLSMKGIPMPKGCGIASAMNPPTENYSGTIDFDDAAFQDRFLHIKFQPRFEEFYGYQKGKFPNSGLLAYLQEDTKMLRDQSLESFDLNFVKPSPRSWESVFALEQMYDAGEMDRSLFMEMMMGMVGLEATTAGMTYKDTHVGSIKGKDIIESYHKEEVSSRVKAAVKKNRTDIIGNAIQEINELFKARGSKGLNKQEGLNVIAVCKDLSPEQTYTLLTIVANNHECCNNVEGMEGTSDDDRGLLNNDDLVAVLDKTKAAREKAAKAQEKRASKAKKNETEEV